MRKLIIALCVFFNEPRIWIAKNKKAIKNKIHFKVDAWNGVNYDIFKYGRDPYFIPDERKLGISATDLKLGVK